MAIFRHHTRWRIGCIAAMAGTMAGTMAAMPGRAVTANEIHWIETFDDDPVAAGRFFVAPPVATGRFSYDAKQQRVTADYDTSLPTAWYVRPLDPVGGRVLGRYDAVTMTVDFRLQSAGYQADPLAFAQIAWGLLNTQTTGRDRVGGTSGPFAFDVLSLDYFPAVNPQFNLPTLAPTLIHSDFGQGFFNGIDFAAGAESGLNAAQGDVLPQLDTDYRATIKLDPATQIITLTITEGGTPLNINTHGAGGFGGLDDDPTTIQTIINIDLPFAVDAFALMAWEDTDAIFGGVVRVRVDVTRIEVFAPAVLLGDINLDGRIDGRDVAPFIALATAVSPDPSLVARGDFDGDDEVDAEDAVLLAAALLERMP